MSYKSVCPLEAIPQHASSPGPVDDTEFVTRAAFTSHINHSTGKIKPAFISQNQFRGQQVSVWRVTEVTEEQLRPLIPLIRVREGERVEFLLSVRVEQIRLLGRNEDSDTRFCVFDECQIDLAGNSHKQHAHVSSCRKKVSFLEDDKNFETALMKLRTLFLNGNKFQVN
jgi:hypothetical protein